MGVIVERTLRVPGGKTVTVTMRISNCRILAASITGDFFAYPEDAVDKLERALLMCASTDCIERAIQTVSQNTQLLGLSWEELKHLLVEAFREGCS